MYLHFSGNIPQKSAIFIDIFGKKAIF